MNGKKRSFLVDIASRISELTQAIKKSKLNADISKSVSELQSAMNQFELKLKLHKFLMRGKGLDFDGYREYTYSDDASRIDWKASIRSNQTLVKQYVEEKDLKIMFLVDVGENMVFGSTPKLKCEYTAELVAALSYVVMFSGNKSGYVMFSDKVKRYVRPGGSEKHFGMLTEDICNSDLYGGASRIGRALNFALENLGRGIDSLIIVSDFATMTPELKKQLSFISGRYETLCLVIKDPLDKELPDVDGEFVVRDNLTGEQIIVNPRYARERYNFSVKEELEKTYSLFRELGIDYLELRTDEPFAFLLANFLKGRIKNI